MNSTIMNNNKFKQDMHECPAHGLTAQSTPCITMDGTEILYPYETVDGVDPTCFTHDGKEILYKDTNYYKQKQVQSKQLVRFEEYKTNMCSTTPPKTFEEWLISLPIEKPILKRDTCMHNSNQKPFDFADLSIENFTACSENPEQTAEDNKLIDWLLNIVDSPEEDVSIGGCKVLNSNPLLPPVVSALQWSRESVWASNSSDSVNDDIYIPDEDEYIIELNQQHDAEENRRDCSWTRQTNQPDHDYSWVNILKNTADFEMYKHLLDLMDKNKIVEKEEFDQTLYECEQAKLRLENEKQIRRMLAYTPDENIENSAEINTGCTIIDFSQYSDCFEPNDYDDEVELVQLHEIELPLTSEDDGPIAEPKRMQRLTGEEFTRQDLILIESISEETLACIKAFVGKTSNTSTITDADRIRGYRFVPDIEYGCEGKDLPTDCDDDIQVDIHDDIHYSNYDDFHYNI